MNDRRTVLSMQDSNTFSDFVHNSFHMMESHEVVCSNQYVKSCIGMKLIAAVMLMHSCKKCYREVNLLNLTLEFIVSESMLIADEEKHTKKCTLEIAKGNTIGVDTSAWQLHSMLSIKRTKLQDSNFIDMITLLGSSRIYASY